MLRKYQPLAEEPLIVISYFKVINYYYVCTVCVRVQVHMPQWSEVNFQESVLSFHQQDIQ